VQQQAQATLNAQSAAAGLTDEVTKAGAAGKAAGDATAGAMDGATQSIDAASAAASNLATNASDAASSVGDIGSRAQSTTSSLASATQGIVLLSAEQLRGLREVGEELTAGTLSLEQYEDRIKQVMTGTSKAIEEQQELLKRSKGLEQDLLLQIAQQNGDDIEQENIRHEQALDNLKSELTVDGELNTVLFAKLQALENTRHNNAIANIKSEAKAKQAGNDSVSTDSGDPSTTTGPGGGQFTSGHGVSRDLGRITFNLGNGQTGTIRGTAETAADFRKFLDLLRKSAAVSGLGSTIRT
jgi:hypothetical protein